MYIIDKWNDLVKFSWKKKKHGLIYQYIISHLHENYKVKKKSKLTLNSFLSATIFGRSTSITDEENR